MASISIDIVRDEYPGMSDEEAARAFAKKNGYAVVVRYKHPSSSEYTHFGLCRSPEDASGYLNNTNCKDPEVIYGLDEVP